MAKGKTNVYVSIDEELDIFIDKERIRRVEEQKRTLKKSDLIIELINKGRDVVNGLYIKVHPSLDEQIAQMKDLIIEVRGKKIHIQKTKQQVYEMLIEKGLEHLDD